MRASSLFFVGLAVAIITIASANAQKAQNVQNSKKPTPLWRTFSECVAVGKKQAWGPNEVSWFCGNQLYPRESNK
jgi:hypothetical protein